MSKTFSLRGVYEIADNSVGPTLNIFDYVSPDRTRAWKVVRAYFWPVDTRADTGSDGNGKYVMTSTLYTDFAKQGAWDAQIDPEDNRAFGFGIWSGYKFENGGSDFIAAHGSSGIVEYVIDPDTLVSKELHIAFASTAFGTTNPTRKWAYMIQLEAKKVTPSESLFQQIKGMGQNINNP